MNNYYYQHFYQNPGYPRTQANCYPHIRSPYYKNYLLNYYRYPNTYHRDYYKNLKDRTLQKKRNRSLSKTSSSRSSSDDSDSDVSESNSSSS